MNQTLGIKSLRREGTKATTLETKAQAIRGNAALLFGVYMLCCTIIIKVAFALKIQMQNRL